jgi:hypothetical protein
VLEFLEIFLFACVFNVERRRSNLFEIRYSTASTSPVRHCAHVKLLKPTGGLELGILVEPVILFTDILYIPLSAIVNCG